MELFSKNSNLCDHDTQLHGETDRRTDRQTDDLP